ncbi:hypothetical protein [Microbacterium sp. NIBRBAC000506063]|uniref:hypothetical protein n=1 Tax=Microbacterium sp. NIBRBAC000506063 TaxID=2734618 RepID=UPI001BB5A147|nr:hypothetical protein [Microbacterium sp. NIBRBAC000506063]QTV80186.1 hypothetical protein KAE78_03865 [Microbacterium sp. NIBRBAC000506063]
MWLGGSEHSFFSYNRDTFARTSGSITKAGGDYQAAAAGNGLVYGGCHCGDFVYQDAYFWDNVGTNWTQADKISLFGAWDQETHRYVQDFSPILEARAGYGVWAIFVDSRGIVWAGGDLSRSLRANFVSQWSGGYVRYAPATRLPRRLRAVLRSRSPTRRQRSVGTHRPTAARSPMRSSRTTV